MEQKENFFSLKGNIKDIKTSQRLEDNICKSISDKCLVSQIYENKFAI